MNIFWLSFKDYTRFEFFKYALLSTLIGFSFIMIVGYYFFTSIKAFLDAFFMPESEGFFAWLYSFAFVSFIIHSLNFLVVGFFVIFTSSAISLFILSFFTPKIAAKINAKYYHHEPKEKMGDVALLLELFKILLKFILLFFLALILFFIPFVNLIAFFLAFYYLFHNALILEVLSAVLDKKKFKEQKFTPFEFKFHTLIFYLLASFPLAGLVLQLFFVIFLIHLSYQKIYFLSPKLDSFSSST